MRYSKIWNAGIGCLILTLGARNVIWAFLFHFSFISSASWLVLRGVMFARSRINLNQYYVPCSLYQMCLVHDSGMTWVGQVTNWWDVFFILTLEWQVCTTNWQAWCSEQAWTCHWVHQSHTILWHGRKWNSWKNILKSQDSCQEWQSRCNGSVFFFLSNQQLDHILSCRT